jgi:hypothetical protein
MKQVKFYPSSQDVVNLVPPPKPAKAYMPEWYKKIKPVDKNSPKFRSDGLQMNVNLKQCMPFLDTFTTGYIQETWSDIFISVDQDSDGNYIVDIGYPMGPEQVNYRLKPTMIDVTSEYFPIEFIWIEPWIPQLPDGYSMILTHPLNRIDLPFYSLTGIIDSDNFYHEINGSYPFFLKKEFNKTIIPAGTPMYQMIPMKRDSWQMEAEEFNEKEMLSRRKSIRKYIYDGYRNFFWQKKEYK